MLADELRVATTWAGVTPLKPRIDPPVLMVEKIDGKVVFLWSTNSPGFDLQMTSALLTNSLWQNAVGTTGSMDSFFTFTNASPDSAGFFRLHK